MKIYFTILFWLLGLSLVNAQTTKVAILDFENTSGKAEYDALGKAVSSMLITDLSNNIHPRKIEFYERNQLNKLLEEQRLQKSKNFDSKTAVAFGKLSGVNFVFIGTVFVLNGTCNITANLVDVQTSKIVLAKDVNGKLESFLILKTQLAEAIAYQLKVPIQLSSQLKEGYTSIATINQYAKVLSYIDEGDLDKAEQIRSLFEETNPEFKYFELLKEDIEKLKLRVSELESVTGIITNSFDIGTKALVKADYPNVIKYFTKYLSTQDNEIYAENKKLYAFCKLALSYYRQDNYKAALENATSALQIYKYNPDANKIALLSHIKLNTIDKAKAQYIFIIDSLTLDNELIFVRNEINGRLKWERIRSFYYGLKIKGNTDIEEKNDTDEKWGYMGLSEYGFGTNIDNEIVLKEYLKSERIAYDKLFQGFSQYSKLEKQLLEFRDTLLFSSDQILNFYKLSLIHGEELLQQKKLAEYRRHLEKEIKRMDAFGVECEGCIPRRPVGASNKRYDEIQNKLWRLGLSNSLKEFWEQFPTIYGEFVLNYLIVLIAENQVNEAAALYSSLLKMLNRNRESYFYRYNWDVILKLRIISDDFYSRQELSPEIFTKKLDARIQQLLSKHNISLAKFNPVKEYQINKKIGSLEVEEDLRIKTPDLIWSKNLSIVKDEQGREILFAKNETELKQFSRDSIPAYCYYDFDDTGDEDYGKLYNYYAMKRIASNPPSGWRIAIAEDYSNLFYQTKDFQILNLPMPGEFNNTYFKYINKAAFYWTGDQDLDNPIYQIVVSIFENKEFSLEGINCFDCYYSIRLVKNK